MYSKRTAMLFMQKNKLSVFLLLVLWSEICCTVVLILYYTAHTVLQICPFDLVGKASTSKWMKT